MADVASMIGGSNEITCGIRISSLSVSLTKPPRSPVSLSTPSGESNIELDWAEQQFHAMGRRDARDLALQLVISYEGSAVLTNALAQPELMAHEARRLEKWINALQA
ncbi:hypothetical protein A5658_15865 [Mycobacterium sp. 1245111.1]|uniref:hypothetical protein n=1 Tax=Mycobacterium sp. 1245111.1 TaxID=1834073 RepID=UPI0008008987|nr:hypothetical protein [Mycobacterium sp. 1245111.1]OBK32515.1 hypothetical protein A5658_15865 [Mycobacterium sp. 1245111.1]